MWGKGAHRASVPNPGKRQRGRPNPSSGGHPLPQLNAREPEYVPSLSEFANTTKAAYTRGQLNNHKVEILLDSGASCSVVVQDYVSPSKLEPMGPTCLVNADGRALTPVGLTTMEVCLPSLTTRQTFVVVEHLSAPAILGCDFLTRHGLIIDFEKGTFHSRGSMTQEGRLSLRATNSCMLVLDGEYPQAAPFKDNTATHEEFDTPKDYHPALATVLKEHEDLFKTQLGTTDIAEHVIDTGDAEPVKVPPAPYPSSTKTAFVINFKRWPLMALFDQATVHGVHQLSMCQRATVKSESAWTMCSLTSTPKRTPTQCPKQRDPNRS